MSSSYSHHCTRGLCMQYSQQSIHTAPAEQYHGDPCSYPVYHTSCCLWGKWSLTLHESLRVVPSKLTPYFTIREIKTSGNIRGSGSCALRLCTLLYPVHRRDTSFTSRLCRSSFNILRFMSEFLFLRLQIADSNTCL